MWLTASRLTILAFSRVPATARIMSCDAGLGGDPVRRVSIKHDP
jgi:hypothetical protein